MQIKKTIISTLLQTTLLQTTLFILSLTSAWITLAIVDFGFSIWFDIFEIHQFIQNIGPHNTFKDGFGTLTRDTYIALFHEINIAIHIDPNQLKHITYSYTTASGDTVQTHLLRLPEIIHLQDVAHIIEYGFYLGIASIIGLCIFVCTQSNPFFQQHNAFLRTDLIRHVILFWCILGSIIMLIFLTKPVAIFYWLHEIIFPDNHQWFFYYQESLMTTLMKAPSIFGPITASLVIICILFHLLYATLLKRLLSTNV